MGRAATPVLYLPRQFNPSASVVNWEATEASADLEKVGTQLAFQASFMQSNSAVKLLKSQASP